jgi:hypothetical protein
MKFISSGRPQKGPSGHHTGGYNGPDHNSSGAFGGDDGSGKDPGNGHDLADNPGNREAAERQAEGHTRYYQETHWRNGVKKTYHVIDRGLGNRTHYTRVSITNVHPRE